MGNWLRRSRSAHYSLESGHSASSTRNQRQSNKKSSKPGNQLLSLEGKIGRHSELRLAQILQDFPVRWKILYFGTFMNIRYKNEDIDIQELNKIMETMTKNVRALNIKPAGELDLWARRISCSTNNDLRSYGIKVIKHLNSVNQFAMHGLFAENALTYAGIESFIQNIARNLSKLQRLNLSINGRMIDDEALKMMSIELGRGLVNLKGIFIQFYECPNTTEKGIGFLLSGLNRYATRLTQLGLSCANNIDDKRIEIIGENLHRYLRNLRSFDFRVRNGDNVVITDQGLETLGNKISKHLTNLEHLTLSFLLNQITDKGVEVMLSKICSKITNLKSISLSFSYCSTITEATFVTIMKIVSQTQKNLTGLSLSFRENRTISVDAFKVLSSINKKQLESLEYLKLDLVGCSKLTDEAIHTLIGWINGRQRKLKRFFMNINHCNQITNECEDQIYHELSYIPEMDISGKLRC